MSTTAAEPVPADTLLRARPRVQASFRAGAVGDPLERQADEFADRVLRMPDPGPALAADRPGDHGRHGATAGPATGAAPAQFGPLGGQSGSVRALVPGGPGGCCASLSPPVACPADPTACSDTAWVDVVMDYLRTVPSPPDATFRTEILADARREAGDDVTATLGTWQALPAPRRTMTRFLARLGDACRTRATELRIEYRFNVVFANVAGEPKWGSTPAWSDVVAALEAVPSEHLSRRPGRTTPVIFRRRALHPRDLAAGTRRIGGEAVRAEGEIEVYDPGVSAAPYGRSRAIGITGTSQTVRHELGHTVEALVPPADRDDFKENVVGWIDYSRHWITQGRPSPTCDPDARGLARQGCEVCSELGFVTGGQCDDARLDAFLASAAGGPQTHDGRRYSLGDHFLASVPTDRVPQTRDFRYANDSFGEYFAEVYTFAVSVPHWLHRVLPAAQTDWLKRHVFDTSRHISEVYALLALGEPYATEFLTEARFVFTRQQLLTVVDQVLGRMALERAGAQAA